MEHKFQGDVYNISFASLPFAKVLLLELTLLAVTICATMPVTMTKLLHYMNYIGHILVFHIHLFTNRPYDRKLSNHLAKYN